MLLFIFKKTTTVLEEMLLRKRDAILFKKSVNQCECQRYAVWFFHQVKEILFCDQCVPGYANRIKSDNKSNNIYIIPKLNDKLYL